MVCIYPPKFVICSSVTSESHSAIPLNHHAASPRLMIRTLLVVAKLAKARIISTGTIPDAVAAMSDRDAIHDIIDGQ